MDQNAQRRALKHIGKVENILQRVTMETETDAIIRRHLDEVKSILNEEGKPRRSLIAKPTIIQHNNPETP